MLNIIFDRLDASDVNVLMIVDVDDNIYEIIPYGDKNFENDYAVLSYIMTMDTKYIEHFEKFSKVLIEGNEYDYIVSDGKIFLGV